MQTQTEAATIHQSLTGWDAFFDRSAWTRVEVFVGDLGQLFDHGPVSAAFVAVRVLGERRAEWDKVVSLAEAQLAETEEAAISGGIDSAAWTRVVNLGKVVRDVALANGKALAEAERKVSLLAMLEMGRSREDMERESEG